MPDDKKDAFPMLSAKNWWALREKFQKAIPATVTDTYLATSLDMQVRSARLNVLNPLKTINLITEDGKPTDLVKQWRDDQEYSKVCQIIRQSCYPQELLDLFPGPEGDAPSVSRWFMNHTGVGESAAGKQASFFLLLTKADVSTNSEGKTTSPSKPKTVAKPAKEAQKPVREPDVPPPTSAPSAPNIETKGNTNSLPSLHIDIQIHIAPDTPADQIDRIFASMAKHLQGMKGNDSE